MAKNYDDIGGVWRTIGGRRVFIKDGQSLDDAMKESGKFKKIAKIVEKDKKTDNTLNRMKAIEDQERYDRLYNKYKEDGMDEEKIKKILGERPKTGLEDEYQKQAYENYKANYDYERNMPEGAKFSKMLEESGVRTFADEIKQKETGYETYLRDTEGTTNEELINAGREQEKRVDYQKYKNETIRTINKYRMEKGTTSLQQAYKKAFEEYKKIHPNTKLNLEEFIKMSEE